MISLYFLYKMSLFCKNEENTLTTHFPQIFMDKSDVFQHPSNITELLKAKLKWGPTLDFSAIKHL